MRRHLFASMLASVALASAVCACRRDPPDDDAAEYFRRTLAGELEPVQRARNRTVSRATPVAVAKPTSTLAPAATQRQTTRFEPAPVEPDQVQFRQPAWLTKALRAARKPRVVTPPPCANPSSIDALQALAAPDRNIVRCCARSRDDYAQFEGQFALAAKADVPCSLFISSPAGGWLRARDAQSLVEVLGPVRSESEALGRVALTHDAWLLEPNRAYPERVKTAAAPKLERIEAPRVTRDGAEFVIEAPIMPARGCTDEVGLQMFRVSATGKVIDGNVKLVRPARVDYCRFDE